MIDSHLRAACSNIALWSVVTVPVKKRSILKFPGSDALTDTGISWVAIVEPPGSFAVTLTVVVPRERGMSMTFSSVIRVLTTPLLFEDAV